MKSNKKPRATTKQRQKNSNPVNITQCETRQPKKPRTESERRRKEPSTTDLLPKKPRPKRKEKPQHNDRQESRCLNIFPKHRPGFHSTRTAQFTMGLHPCRPPKPWMSTTPSMRTAPHSHGHTLQPFSSYMLDTLNQSHQKSLDLNMTPRNTCQA